MTLFALCFKYFTLFLFVCFFTVMRLTRPSLYTTYPVASDSRYSTCNILNDALKKDLGSPDKLEYFNSGNLLMLPQSFGYLFN